MMTDNEKRILEILRTLKPFERIEVQADQSGKPDYYIVHRSYKEILATK
jgi:hypothetical protein